MAPRNDEEKYYKEKKEVGLVAIGISHKTAPVDIREKFSFTTSGLKDSFAILKDSELISGAVILSTCNRMEIYVDTLDNKLCVEFLKRFLVEHFDDNQGQSPKMSQHLTSEVSEIDNTQTPRFQTITKDSLYNYFQKYFYVLQDDSCLLHLYKVASGLDSQVIGERQILGQVRQADLNASEHKAATKLLRRIFSFAIKTGKKVREETLISQGNVSIGTVAMRYLKERLICLKDKTALIIGIGKIGHIISQYLQDEGVKAIFISNRTYDKACEAAKECNGQAIHFDQLEEKLPSADIVISSTSSPHIIIKKQALEKIMQSRSKPLILLDLAVPRDIDSGVRDIANVTLFDLDDLKNIAEDNLGKRKQEESKALKIIEEEAEKLWESNAPLKLEPAPAL